MTTTTATLQELIAAALAAPFAEEYAAQEAALQKAETSADWQECFDAFGERTIAEFVCEWADESAYGPADGEGASYITLDDGSAIVAEWRDSGNYYVTFCTLAEAEQCLADINAECDARDAEEEESEDDDSSAEDAGA